jgi:signal transduction histidine kinase
LTNALRHAGYGAAVTVTLTFQPGAVTVEVVDDGAGNLVVVGGDGADTRQLPGTTKQLPGTTKQLPGTTKQLPGATTPLPAAPAGGGHGLIGMRERVAVHGGTFEAGPRLGGGWQVKALVPVKGTP